MIKTIKPGNKIFTCTCPVCGCHFSYEPEDVSYLLGSWVDGPFGEVQTMDYYIPCPQCSIDIYLSVPTS